MTPDGCPIALVPSRQKQHRLRPDEINQLIDEYHAGATAAMLAKLHSVRRTTVLELLERAGVPRRYRVLTPEMIQEAITAYEAGQSLAKIAKPLGVDDTTIWHALTMRSPNGPKRTTPD
jgi:hypothetical protein